MRDDIDAIMQALAAPFEPSEVKFKPGAVSGSLALALCYIDARVVMDRLDEVLGVDGWQDGYDFLPDGSAVCTLRCRIGGEWITKVDVGGQSEQPDEGDRHKAAVSDALKRAAVKFAVGRYLYRLPARWADYDAKTKKFTREPALPDWALPRQAEKVTTKKTLPAVERVTTAQAKELKQAILEAQVEHGQLFIEFDIARLTELPAAKHKAALDWCRSHKANGRQPERKAT